MTRWAALLVIAAALPACEQGSAPRKAVGAAAPTVASDRPSVFPLRPNRAYDGAPPVIPHQIKELGRQNCILCHLAGDAKAAGGNKASRTPHPELENCAMCHLEKHADTPFRESSFVPRTWQAGVRAHPAAPWRIPHPLTMRENCMACHTDSPTMPAALATTHPDRPNCVQCHVPANPDFPGPRPGVHPASAR